MAKHDGNCCCTSCAAKRYVRNGERAVRELYGSGTDSDPSGFGDCPDCGGTGDCPHCKQGIYYKRNGQSAVCSKCRGRLKCHSCRGKGRGGRECRVPRYVEPGKKRVFPPDNATINGQSAYVKQEGQRTEGYYGRGKEGKIVANDGINADYVRNDDEIVIVDHSKNRKNPYEPYRHERKR